MKKTLLVSLLLILGCTSEYRYCDSVANRCYDCDSVGCTYIGTLVPNRNDAGDVNNTEAGYPPCFNNVQCVSTSRCIDGECRVPCTNFDDCQRVDGNFVSCMMGLCNIR